MFFVLLAFCVITPCENRVQFVNIRKKSHGSLKNRAAPTTQPKLTTQHVETTIETTAFTTTKPIFERKLLVIGGHDTRQNRETSDVEMFNVEGSSYGCQKVQPIPFSGRNVAGMVNDSLVVCSGAKNDQVAFSKRCFKLNSKSGKWEESVRMKWNHTEPIAVDLPNGMLVIDSYDYMFDSRDYDKSGLHASAILRMESLNDTGVWTVHPSLTVWKTSSYSFRPACIARINSSIYGVERYQSSSDPITVMVYSLEKQRWFGTAPVDDGYYRGTPTCGVTEKQQFFFYAGRSDSKFGTKVYDPKRNEWTGAHNFSTNMNLDTYTPIVYINRKPTAIGVRSTEGYDESFLQLDGGAWKTLPMKLNISRNLHSAVMVPVTSLPGCQVRGNLTKS